MPWIVTQRLCESTIATPLTWLPRMVSPTRLKVDRIPPEHAFFAKMGEAGVADAALAEAVIDRVPPNAFGIGALDGHVPREVCNFSLESPTAGMLVLERLIQHQTNAFDLLDPPAFGGDVFRVVPQTAAARFPDGAGDDDFIAFSPAGDGFGSVNSAAPTAASAASLTQVRLIGAPWISILAEQQARAGASFLSRPSR